MKKIEIRDITEKDVWQRLPLRVQDSHKGTYGKLLCVAGSSRYRGAAALTAEGALRGGCGIVTLASVEPVFASVQPRLPECILLCCEPDLVGGISEKNAGLLQRELENDYAALLLGPGMGNTKSTGALVRILVSGADCTVILDADALNAVSADEKLPAPLPGRRIVITPHPGEMARLCGCSIADIKAGREEISLDYAKKNGCIVVLKEHRTLIASPEGELWRNTSGNSGLARGGSGDILAGMLATGDETSGRGAVRRLSSRCGGGPLREEKERDSHAAPRYFQRSGKNIERQRKIIRQKKNGKTEKSAQKR